MRNFGLVFVGSLLFHLAGSWLLPLIDRDEPRFAEASREMLARGDYVIPYFNNRYRFDKPPLTYWAQTLSYRVFGENDFAARFPSALAAALTAVVIFAWGRRMKSERVAWWAALIFTLCLQTFIHARAAVADMWLVLFVTAAHWAGYELLRDRLTSDGNARLAGDSEGGRVWCWIFYLALALGFLAKEPIAWTPLLALCLTRAFLTNLSLNRRFHFLPGLLLMLALVAIWGVPALRRTGGEFFRIGIGKHVVERSIIAMEGHGGTSWWLYSATAPYYFVTIFLTFFPWSFKLPWLTKILWRKRDPLDNYLLAGAAVIFLIFTLVKTKLPHYTLPAFPLLALLLAKNLERPTGNERFVRRAAIGASAIALLLLCVSPFAARYAPSFQLAQQARHDLRRKMEFGGVNYREPSLVWYFRKQVDGWFSEVDENRVPEFMSKAGGRFIIMPTAMAEKIYPAIPVGWKSYRVKGFSPANFKWVDLTLVLKPTS